MAEVSVIGGLFMVLLVEQVSLGMYLIQWRLQVVLDLKERGVFGRDHLRLHEHSHEEEETLLLEEDSKLGSFLLVGFAKKRRKKCPQNTISMPIPSR